MPVVDTIKNNPALKKFVHRLLLPEGGARPRLWVRVVLNRFFHTRGKSAVIRHTARMDVLPFNKFTLGANSVIEDFCTINNGVGDVSIGDNTLIGMGNVIIGPVSIGNNIIFAQNIVVSGLNHEYRNVDMPIVRQPVTMSPICIEDDCWIAANVVITSGVTIGKHCVIAAGAVVTKSIPAFSVAAGNPARVIRQFDRSLNEWVKV
jgi:acetyltransferase-like isoleucine patch superfamily enzyme